MTREPDIVDLLRDMDEPLREHERLAAAAEIERLGNLAAIVREQGFEIERLRAVLRFYADSNHDNGKRARAALEPKGGIL